MHSPPPPPPPLAGNIEKVICYGKVFLRGYLGGGVKLIFHCDAKPFALGTGVGLDALPNAKDTNMLVSFPLGDANFSYPPTQNLNASQWNIGCVGFQTQIFCVGHVHFMFFVLISFAFGGQRKPSFQWNLGLRPSEKSELL